MQSRLAHVARLQLEAGAAPFVGGEARGDRLGVRPAFEKHQKAQQERDQAAAQIEYRNTIRDIVDQECYGQPADDIRKLTQRLIPLVRAVTAACANAKRPRTSDPPTWGGGERGGGEAVGLCTGNQISKQAVWLHPAKQLSKQAVGLRPAK